MKLRQLILLTSALGASGALLLAADLYRRLRGAESAAALHAGPPSDDSILFFGMQHTLGLIALAFLFLALFLLLIIALRDRAFVAAIEGEKQAAPVGVPPAPVELRGNEASPAAPIIEPSPEPVEVVPVDAAPAEIAPAPIDVAPAPVEIAHDDTALVPVDSVPAPIEPAPAPVWVEVPTEPAPPAVDEPPPPEAAKRVLAFETPLENAPRDRETDATKSL